MRNLRPPWSEKKNCTLKTHQTMSGILIRDFADDDAKRVGQILFDGFIPVFASYMAETAQTEPDDPETIIASVRAQNKTSCNHAWVAVVDNTVVGYLLVGANYRYKLGTLEVISVDPQVSIHGVGSALLAEAEIFWQILKMRKIYTCVASINPRAQAFYQRHGFVAEGILKDHYFAGVDEICLAKFYY